MPSDRIGITTAVVSNAQGQTILYAIGGRSTTSTAPFGSGGVSTVQAYNAATNSWITRARFPYPLQYSNGTGVINGKIYVSGGAYGYKSYSEALFMYDPTANVWTAKRSMPRTTFGGVSAVISNKLYVLTSCEGQEDCFPSMWPDLSFYRYDPVTDEWTELPAPPSGSDHFAGVAGAIGQKFYVVGGSSSTDNALEVYDPATNKWSTKASMASIRYSVAGGAVNGKLYVIAGSVRNKNWTSTCGCPYSTDVPTTSIYNPVTDTWKNMTPAPFAGGGRAAGRVVVGGQVRIDVVRMRAEAASSTFQSCVCTRIHATFFTASWPWVSRLRSTRPPVASAPRTSQLTSRVLPTSSSPTHGTWSASPRIIIPRSAPVRRAAPQHGREPERSSLLGMLPTF